VENDEKSLRRIEESIVVEDLQSTLVEVPNSGGWGVRVLREERTMNRGPKLVRQGACATSAPIPLSSQNAGYELFKLGHFPGSV